MKPLIPLLILLASCTKEVSKPVTLRPPQRSIQTVDVTIRFFTTSHPLAPGNLYGLELRSSVPLKQKTTFKIQWKDDSRTWVLEPFILAGYKGMDWHTMLPRVGEVKDLVLLGVDDNTIVYRLKQIQ